MGGGGGEKREEPDHYVGFSGLLTMWKGTGQASGQRQACYECEPQVVGSVQHPVTECR